MTTCTGRPAPHEGRRRQIRKTGLAGPREQRAFARSPSVRRRRRTTMPMPQLNTRDAFPRRSTLPARCNQIEMRAGAAHASMRAAERIGKRDGHSQSRRPVMCAMPLMSAAPHRREQRSLPWCGSGERLPQRCEPAVAAEQRLRQVGAGDVEDLAVSAESRSRLRVRSTRGPLSTSPASILCPSIAFDFPATPTAQTRRDRIPTAMRGMLGGPAADERASPRARILSRSPDDVGRDAARRAARTRSSRRKNSGSAPCTRISLTASSRRGRCRSVSCRLSANASLSFDAHAVGHRKRARARGSARKLDQRAETADPASTSASTSPRRKGLMRSTKRVAGVDVDARIAVRQRRWRSGRRGGVECSAQESDACGPRNQRRELRGQAPGWAKGATR